MKSRQPNAQPPVWATKILKWYCHRSLAEDLEGDLHEFYLRNLASRGLFMARLIYFIDVLKFFRIYTIQKPKVNNPLHQFLLLKNFYITSVRNLKHNKLFSFINIVGLAISMSVGLVLIAFISEIYTFDTFHKDADRIYRIKNSYEYLNEPNDSYYASTSALAGQKIEASVPGIESYTIIRRDHFRDFNYQEKTIPFRIVWTSEGFFDVFSFKFLEGNPHTALRDLNSLVITDEVAEKLFGDESALNKQVMMNDKLCEIKGVVAKPPMNSHIQFEVLASYATFANDKKEDNWYLKWTNMWNHYIYFKLKPDQDPRIVQSNLDMIAAEENGKIENTRIGLHLQPLLDIVPGENMNNNFGSSLESSIVWTLLILVSVVIISACFNYTNLSLGRSIKRSMEVGIRKVNGATRFQVWLQFTVEATLIALASLIISLILFLFLRNYFFILDHRIQDMVTLELTPILIGYFILFAVVVGIMAGFFPAVFFSKVPVYKVLKSISKVKVLGPFNYRNILIMLQYTISIIFIVAVTLIYKQYRYSVSFDLGYKTANILNLEFFGENADALANDLKALPEVQTISHSLMLTSLGSYYGNSAKYKDPLDSVHIRYNDVDELYLTIHGHKFLAGQNFIKGSENDSAEFNQVIVNEALIKHFNIGTPEESIGEEITISGNKKVIHGVLKDFHYGKVDSDIGPFVYNYSNHHTYLNLLISTDDIFNTMNKIEKAWKKFDPVHPMSASFYEDAIKEAYEESASMVTIIGFMAFLAIVIASMGLLGMVVFTTESRIKEVSIRKVFGASELNLVYLLGRGFLILLFIAAAIAIPVAYYFVNHYIFVDIIYKTSFGIFDLMLGVIVVMMIALLAICLETFRAARTNPASILRNE